MNGTQTNRLGGASALGDLLGALKPLRVRELEREIDARIRAMLRKRDRLVTLELTVRDLSSTNEQLEKLLMVDDKTGLYNFREFQRRLREIGRAHV